MESEKNHKVSEAPYPSKIQMRRECLSDGVCKILGLSVLTRSGSTVLGSLEFLPSMPRAVLMLH